MARILSYDWPGNVRELKNVAERLVIRARAGVIPPTDLPRDILGKWSKPELAAAQPIRLTPDILFERMTIGGEPFWSVVYEPFMSRDLTRQDLRAIIKQGLEQTRGSYKTLLQLFNLQPEDYKRFLNFLRKHDCHMPFQQFRVVPARADSVRQSPDRLIAG